MYHHESACLKCSRNGNACEFTTSAFLKCFKMECVLSQQSPDIMLEQSVQTPEDFRPGHPILIPLSTTGEANCC